MYKRTGDSGGSSNDPPWLVRAEVTIRHKTPESAGNPGTPESSPRSVGPNVNELSGLRMVYRWNANQSAVTPSPSYGFQRGNILFTSTPPARSIQSSNSRSSVSPTGQGASISDSGYTSEYLSHSRFPSSRYLSQMHNRRCQSTCSITLSSGGENSEKSVNSSPIPQSKEPWSSHQHLSARYRFSTLPEVCEDCAEGSSTTSSAFTTHFCTRVPNKHADKINKTAISRDAASQTTDIETSPILAVKNSKTRRKILATRGIDEQRKRMNVNSPPSPSSIKSSSYTADLEKSDTSSKEDSEKRKSRTVHIDVYCTGTDDDLNESNTDSSSKEEEFEKPSLICLAGKDVRITHKEITGTSILPRGFQDDKAFLKRAAERRCESFRHAPMRMPSLASSKGYESDDVLSSLYPSQFSSYSALRDLDSVPWSAASSISAMTLDTCDSSSATSWKDTISDIESHRTSITPCDSFEHNVSSKSAIFDKSKTWKSPQTERRHLLQSRKIKKYMESHRVDWTSEESNGESDESDAIAWSFLSSEDYNRSVKERKKSPEIANVVLQAKSDFRKIAPPLAKVESFVSSPVATRVTSPTSFGVTSSATSRKSPSSAKDTSPAAKDTSPISRVTSPTSRVTSPISRVTSPISRVTSPTSRVTSPTSRVTSPFTSRVTSPFTTSYGEKTDHIIKASVFGRVVAAFKKPGHHIGPAKNPSCSCDHCRRYFDERSRDRFRSFFDFERRSSSQLSRLDRDNHSTRASSRN
ncbi:flocculation protein FLO11 isoform X2 [Leptopilina heterotoma]|uniref:flocculation protein FLO11 isoform X2 n=1 Tax=Leptopilina heterotoma TaxID=63436 RepID=UPI001CA89570|nr:flocculation protein FLO11 isoform X2 [Leptopilina heterotoma]